MSHNPKYTFEEFIVAPGNETAYKAAIKVSESPGKIYNPLFIHCGVGQGKSHLLKAIANRVIRRNPDSCVIYTPEYEFTNEVVEAIRNNQIEDVREKYMRADLLLIDDVHFFGGKPKTQNELLNILNYLLKKERQIVMAGGMSVEKITGITDELKAIFSKSMVVGIQPPSFDTRLAVLYKKAEDEEINLPEDVAHWLAAKGESNNIRILEHFLEKLDAKSKLTGKDITLGMAKNT